MELNPMAAALGALQPARAATGASAAAEAAEGFAAMLRGAEAQAMEGLSGGADPHALVTALAETRLAVDTVVAIRDRAVEAYQEILRMPV